MSDRDKKEALAVGQKIQAQYYQQCGQMLDLTELETALLLGQWSAVNREVIRLTVKAANPNSLN